MTGCGISSLLAHSRYAELILDLYAEFGTMSFTYTEVKEKIPEFSRGSIYPLRNRKVLRLVSGNRRAHQKTNERNRWMFTNDAITFIRDYIERKKEGENYASEKNKTKRKLSGGI